MAQPSTEPVPVTRGSGATRRESRLRAGRVAGAAIAAMFLALLVYGVVAQAPSTGIDENLARGRTSPAPGFDLPVLQDASAGPLQRRLDAAARNGRVDLEELRGVPVLLNFWASWCIPCREEAPLLERTWRRARQQGVLVVGLDMQDVTGDARAFLREFGTTYLNIRDKQDDVARRYGATGIPETFFISASGEVVGHVIGALSSDQASGGVAAARRGRVIRAMDGGDQLPTRG